MILASGDYWSSPLGQVTISVIAAIVTASLFYGIRCVSKLLGEARDTREMLTQRLDIQDHKLASIEHEVRYNTGSSLKDAVIRVEGHLATQDANLSAHRETLESIMRDRAYQLGRFDKYLQDHP